MGNSTKKMTRVHYQSKLIDYYSRYRPDLKKDYRPRSGVVVFKDSKIEIQLNVGALYDTRRRLR